MNYQIIRSTEIVASFQRDGMQNEDEKEVISRAQK